MAENTPEAPAPEKKPKKAKKATLSVVEKTSLQQLLELMNKEYSVILRGSQVLIMRHWKSEDGNSELVFLNKRDFLLLQQNNNLFTDEGKPIKVGEAWLSWTHRSTYEAVYFEPEGRKYVKRYNLWRGFGVKQEAGGKFDIFLDHVRTNICQGNAEHFAWIMAWLADMFQKPARKLGTALVLRGPMRIGKGQFAYHVGKLLGIHYMPITQAGQLTGKFNGHMADKLLMFVDEGWWSGERNGAGILRALITEPEVTVEMKGRDAVTIRNFTRFIIAANADWVVPLGMGDEDRFMMLDVGTAVQRNTAYFKAMEDELRNYSIDENGKKQVLDNSLPENAGYQALLDYLRNYEYDETLVRHIMQTGALQENKIYSMPDELKWWHECLIKGKIGDFPLTESTESNYIETDKFFEQYRKWCESMRYQPHAFNILPKKFKGVIDFIKKEKQSITSERDQFYYLYPLAALRQQFELFLGYAINWDEY